MTDTILPPRPPPLDLPRVPQQARSRAKRDALLAAAARLFEAQGYDAVGADEIASTAGVSTGTFYLYFRNKRQLFLSLLAVCVDTVLSRVTETFDFGSDPRETVRRVVASYGQGDPFYGVGRALRELAPRDPDVAAYEGQISALFHRQLLLGMREAAARGLTWPDLDIEETSRCLTLLIEGHWRAAPSPRALANTTDGTRRLYALADIIYHACFRTP